MKGLVFKELLSMMEEKFGEETTEEIISELELDSGGAYTSVGTYDHKEVLAIVNKLSEKSGAEGSVLVKAFGHHLLGAFYGFHPEYFDKKTAMEFLKSVDNYIHVEVKKLTPDAELPEILVDDSNKDSIKISYKSEKPFADLAEGLIEATINHYDEGYEINIPDKTNPCQRDFFLRKVS